MGDFFLKYISIFLYRYQSDFQDTEWHHNKTEVHDD